MYVLSIADRAQRVARGSKHAGAACIESTLVRTGMQVNDLAPGAILMNSSKIPCNAPVHKLA